MRNRTNWILLAFIVVLTAFSAIVIWPGSPKRYLPDFAPWPEGDGLNGAVRIFSLGLIDDTGGFERQEMRLGLDLKGGSYVLLEADTSRLPPGTDIDDALEGVKDVLERRVNAFGVSIYLAPILGMDYWFAVQMIGIGQLAACYALGLPLLKLMQKRGWYAPL